MRRGVAQRSHRRADNCSFEPQELYPGEIVDVPGVLPRRVAFTVLFIDRFDDISVGRPRPWTYAVRSKFLSCGRDPVVLQWRTSTMTFQWCCRTSFQCLDRDADRQHHDRLGDISVGNQWPASRSRSSSPSTFLSRGWASRRRDGHLRRRVAHSSLHRGGQRRSSPH